MGGTSRVGEPDNNTSRISGHTNTSNHTSAIPSTNINNPNTIHTSNSSITNHSQGSQIHPLFQCQYQHTQLPDMEAWPPHNTHCHTMQGHLLHLEGLVVAVLRMRR